MRLICAAVACLVLTGCDTLRGAITVRVPVPVACEEPVPDRPFMPTDALRPGVDPFTFSKTAQAEIEVRQGYEGRLLTALEACRKPIKTAPP